MRVPSPISHGWSTYALSCTVTPAVGDGSRQGRSRRFEDPHHGDTLPPVGAGSRPAGDAVEEVPALHREGLGWLERHRLGVGLDHLGLPVRPLSNVAVEAELGRPRLKVVEHGHRVLADHHQLAFRHRVQPGHEHVAPNAAGELEVGRRDVVDAVEEVRAALGPDDVGLRSHEGEDHRDVVRGEAAQDVLLAADPTEVQAVGIDVPETTEHSVADHGFQLDECRVVAHEVADHEHAAVVVGEGAKLLGVPKAQGEGLLHENVLARLDGLAGDGDVLGRRNRHHHCVHQRVVEGRLQVRGEHVVLHGHRLGRGRRGVHHQAQGAQLVKGPHQVATPAPAAHDRHLRRFAKRVWRLRLAHVPMTSA